MKTNSLRRVLTVFVCIVILFSCISPVFAAGTLRAAKITDLYGAVKVYKAGGEKEFPAFKGMSLAEGDSVFTGPGAWATLLIDDDKEAKIGENTRMGISELRGSAQSGDDRTGLSLWAGKIWTGIKEKLNVNSKYEIKTATTVMGVRGTKFFTAYGQGKTYITVIEGRLYAVKVSRDVTPEGDIVEKQLEAFLEENEHATLDDLAEFEEALDIQPVTIENLDTMVLQEIQSDPEGIDEEILNQIDEEIQRRQSEPPAPPPPPPPPPFLPEEQRQNWQQQPPQAPPPPATIQYPGPGTGSPGTSGGSESPMTPVTLGPIDDMELEEGEQETITLATEPEGASISAVSGNEAVAQVSVEGRQLTVTAVSEGTAVITVTASSTGYTSAQRQFAVTVTAAPTPFVLIGQINNMELEVEGQETIYIETEPEGASISAVSGNEAVAQVSVEGKLLTVTALSEGTAVITVTASLAGYTSSQVQFEVHVVSFQGGTTPAKPVILSANGYTISPAYGIETTVEVVVGNVTPGDTVRLYDGELIIDSAVASGSTVTLTAEVWGEGSHVFTAEAENLEGNISEHSDPFEYILQEMSGYVSNIDTYYFNGRLVFYMAFHTAELALARIGSGEKEYIDDYYIENPGGEFAQSLNSSILVDYFDGPYPYDAGYYYTIEFMDESDELLDIVEGSIPAISDVRIALTSDGLKVEGKAYSLNRLRVTLEDPEYDEIIDSSEDEWINVYNNTFNATLEDPRSLGLPNGVYDIVLTVDDSDYDFGLIIGHIIKTGQGITVKEKNVLPVPSWE